MLLALPSYAIQYVYDDLNRVVSATYAFGTTVYYQYDAGGNLLGISLSKALDDININLSDADGNPILGATIYFEAYQSEVK